MSTSPLRWFDREKFRAVRKERGLSLAALARQADVSPSTIRHWESGLFLPSMESLALVVEALDVSPPAVISIPPGSASLSDLRALSFIPTTEVAESLGMQVSSLYSLERGEIGLSEDRAYILASLFDVSTKDVLDAWDRGREM